MDEDTALRGMEYLSALQKMKNILNGVWLKTNERPNALVAS